MANAKPAATLLILLTLLACLAGVVSVTGESAAGSFGFVIDGYLVTGTLSQGVIGHGGEVHMLMSIEQTVSSQYGPIQVVGSGTWAGETDYHSFSGAITGVAGTIQACVVFYCETGDFTGSGTWSGSMTWSSGGGVQGSGIFQGTLTLTGQQSTAISSSGPVAISGNWTDSFLA